MFEFKNFDYLTDGEIDNSDDGIGAIDIRIGNNENLYYGGHIGYMIKESYRGNSYASKACKMVKDVAVAHGMSRFIITCNPDFHLGKLARRQVSSLKK